MEDRLTLKLQPRNTLGKKVRSLRRAGIIPVHLYGPGIDPRPLQCEGRTLIRVLTQAGGSTAISITVDGDGDEHLAFVREIQWDPIRGELFHVDFLRAEATQLASAEVSVVLIGDSSVAREVNGTVVQQLRSLTIEALPLDMPQELSVDISSLTQPDSVIRAEDVPLPANSTLLTDPENVVARIEVSRVAEPEMGGQAPAEVREQQEEN